MPNKISFRTYHLIAGSGRLCFLIIFYLLFSPRILLSQNVAEKFSQPVIKVDTPNPTADKPQSKLWYMDNCWWAILPRSSGPSLWQRTENGWKEFPGINKALQGVPGRVDIWAEKNSITAVGVDETKLVVFHLESRISKYNGLRWKTQIKTTLYPPSGNERFETATIARDKKGVFWVAATAGKKVCVWNSVAKNKKWNGPFILAEGIDNDDICTIASLPDGVGVIWSNQVRDAVLFRVHKNNKPDSVWEITEIVAAGNKTADDHLNTAITPDGTLWVATKNSLDSIGEPQFILRVRNSKNGWSNYPYLLLDTIEHPSRPIIISTDENPPVILSGHTIYNTKNSFLGNIEFGIIDTTTSSVLIKSATVISPDTLDWKKDNRINDVTSSKKPFPKNAPWIVLASDEEGNIYEADLSLYLNHFKNQVEKR